MNRHSTSFRKTCALGIPIKLELSYFCLIQSPVNQDLTLVSETWTAYGNVSVRV